MFKVILGLFLPWLFLPFLSLASTNHINPHVKNFVENFDLYSNELFSDAHVIKYHVGHGTKFIKRLCNNQKLPASSGYEDVEEFNNILKTALNANINRINKWYNSSSMDQLIFRYTYSQGKPGCGIVNSDIKKSNVCSVSNIRAEQYYGNSKKCSKKLLIIIKKDKHGLYVLSAFPKINYNTPD